MNYADFVQDILHKIRFSLYTNNAMCVKIENRNISEKEKYENECFGCGMPS